jgi:chaperone modulatory protein CbpM
MTNHDILTGDILDEVTLTIEEIAQACSVKPEWVVARVDAGLLNCTILASTTWHFVSADLARARQLVAIERDFDANEELAALVVDLMGEVRRLKQKLKTAGIDDTE